MLSFFSDDSNQENLLSSAIRGLTETRIGIPDEPLEAHSPLNIKGGVLEKAENFDTDHLKLQNTLDENCSDSIHSPVIKDISEELDSSDNQEMADIPTENQRSKKYSEFLGKRYSEFLGKRGLPKRFSEFLGKRLGQIKRFSEFLGKRLNKKRYSEFLGKRNHVQKRYSEFLGKRFYPRKRYSDFLMGKRYSDFLMGKRNIWSDKRQGEWVGK